MIYELRMYTTRAGKTKPLNDPERTSIVLNMMIFEVPCVNALGRWLAIII